MSLKLILHDTIKDVYKVKNAKADEGEVILRRQTWQNETMGWRRHEYKIYQDQVFYRTLPNGQVITETKSGLADFPVLVHYFKKRPYALYYLFENIPHRPTLTASLSST